ncbi:hypothetical protein [Candidatus Amarolinea dominans]|uniref:hypothetical protein n=1 Tax=Candidatus Amarolinea dominans TaxID=3140696 RepID=UPI001D849B53|nr:hypothetical protein [Anaerolineae bacterium]
MGKQQRFYTIAEEKGKEGRREEKGRREKRKGEGEGGRGEGGRRGEGRRGEGRRRRGRREKGGEGEREKGRRRREKEREKEKGEGERERELATAESGAQPSFDRRAYWLAWLALESIAWCAPGGCGRKALLVRAVVVAVLLSTRSISGVMVATMHRVDQATRISGGGTRASITVVNGHS